MLFPPYKLNNKRHCVLTNQANLFHVLVTRDTRTIARAVKLVTVGDTVGAGPSALESKSQLGARWKMLQILKS